MKSKGFDISRSIPKGLHQIPNLDHYQIIVTLSPDTYKLFPQKPRKTIFFDWHIDDPSKATSDCEASFEETFIFVKSHVEDLIQAILGTQKKEEKK